MPDTFDSRYQGDAPVDWGPAFATLPLEAPSAQARSRFQQALHAHARQSNAPRRDRRRTWAVAMACAAVLALVIAAPMLGLDGHRSRTQPTARQIATAPSTSRPVVPPSPAPAPVPSRTAPTDAPPSTGLRLVQRALPGLERAYPEPSARVDRASARRATDRLVSALPLAQIAATAEADQARMLAQLQQQAQTLEALVALASDERVGHGAGVALTGELDAQLARIDADLQGADLAPAQRLQLWQQRVQLLEHLAGVATTQRWLAAQGTLDQSSLVSLY